MKKESITFISYSKEYMDAHPERFTGTEIERLEPGPTLTEEELAKFKHV